MKKIVFSAIALMVFSTNSIANNEIVSEKNNLKTTIMEQQVEDKDKKPCVFYVKGVDIHGRKFHTKYTVTNGDTTLGDCNKVVEGMVKKLTLQNSKVESVQVVWE